MGCSASKPSNASEGEAKGGEPKTAASAQIPVQPVVASNSEVERSTSGMHHDVRTTEAPGSASSSARASKIEAEAEASPSSPVASPRDYGAADMPSWDPDHGTGSPGAVTVKHVTALEELYEILPQRLGKGSFGEVLLARRASDRGRKDAPLFAIKKLRPDVRNITRKTAKRAVAVARAARKLSEISIAARAARTSTTGSVASAEKGAQAGSADPPSTPTVPEHTEIGGVAAPASGAKDVTDATTPTAASGAEARATDASAASAPEAGQQPSAQQAPAAAAPAAAAKGDGGDEGAASRHAGVGASRSAVVNKSKASAHMEADIMNRVRGHRNMVNLEDIVEDDTCVYIIMEYCSGGDLMKYVVRCSHFSEKVASYLFRQMLIGVAHCHARGVVHRDLKPENFLFFSTEGKAELKIADFGLATVIADPDAEITEGVGSAFFIAPEVLQRRYTAACDTWSLGVNLYLLLSGTVPFGADATKATEVYRAIRKQPLSFSGPAWSAISPLARELVAGLLEKQPFRRYTLGQALAHPWVTSDGAAPDSPLDSSVVRAMTHFNARNRLRRDALRLVSSTLSADDLKTLAAQFHAMDTDADMLVSYQELAAAIRKMGVGDATTEEEVMMAMEAMDADKDGTINLQEFLAATSELQLIEHQNNIWWAFCQYDRNGDGTITLDELREVLKGEGEEAIQEYINEYDADKDGTISYEEFIRMLVPPDMEFTTIRY